MSSNKKPVNQRVKEYIDILTKEKKYKLPQIQIDTGIEYGRLTRIKNGRAKGNEREEQLILKAFPELFGNNQDPIVNIKKSEFEKINQDIHSLKIQMNNLQTLVNKLIKEQS